MNLHRRIAWMPVMVLGAAMLLAASASGQEREGRRRGGPRTRDPQEMLKRMDKDGDGKISKEEFTGPERFFERMDADKDGFVTAKELAAMRQGRGGRGERGRRGGRGGSDDGAPKVGDVAPTFKLKSLDGKQEFDLAGFKGKKPVVLFFGSYT